MPPLSWITCGFLLICISGTGAELLDLTYDFDNATHYWLGTEIFNLTEVFKGSTGDFYYEANRFNAAEHGGTHLDAPCHFHEGGWTVEKIPVTRLVAHAAVVDIADRATDDPDALLTPAELRQWKEKHGRFRYPTVVLVRTGYASRWEDREAYFGTRPEEPGVRHFPGVGAEAATVLAAEPAVVGVGIDTPSIDAGVDSLFPTHQILAAENIYILENVADMSRVPATGATIIAFPMKIAGGSGGPCRVVVQMA